MNKRYVPANKALDLNNFGADSAFGGSSGAIGRLTDERVMDIVIDTIGEHLSDLEAINLSNNNLRTLRVFSKVVGKAPNIKIIYLNSNKVITIKVIFFRSFDLRPKRMPIVYETLKRRSLENKT